VSDDGVEVNAGVAPCVTVCVTVRVCVSVWGCRDAREPLCHTRGVPFVGVPS
jgi:hypothetical protein